MTEIIDPWEYYTEDNSWEDRLNWNTYADIQSEWDADKYRRNPETNEPLTSDNGPVG